MRSEDAADATVVPLPEAPDWTITPDPEHRLTHAIGVEPDQVSLTIEGDGKAFKRTFIKPAKGYKHRILVGELDGVRVYIDGNRVVMTMRDLYL